MARRVRTWQGCPQNTSPPPARVQSTSAWAKIRRTAARAAVRSHAAFPNKWRTTMAHSLPPLPYAFDALEPHIDARTMEIHHDKHHAAYVNNLNAALEKAPEQIGRASCRERGETTRAADAMAT